MKSAFLASAAVSLCAMAGSAGALNVIVTGSGNSSHDQAVQMMLEGYGHTVTVWPQFFQLNGSEDYSGFDVVYFQYNYNWGSGIMPILAQNALVDFVRSGGGVVTTEWLKWRCAVDPNNHQALVQLIPADIADGSWQGATPVTYTQTTPDPIINAGMPAAFTFAETSVSGTESRLVPRQRAVSFYSSDYGSGGQGVVGWSRGRGRAISLSTVCGPGAVADANWARMLNNCLEWVNIDACQADFDGDGFLTGLDFDTYVAMFEAGDPDTDFDGDGFATGIDFDLFVEQFEYGC